MAILLDLADLEQQAGRDGAQVSYSRLVRRLAGRRRVVRSVAYLTDTSDSVNATLRRHKIDAENLEDAAAIAVALTVDAMALAETVQTVVIGAALTTIAPLTRALRDKGVRVESASFDPESTFDSHHHHTIGRDCLFVP